MIKHARDEAPNEACGLLAGSSGQVAQLYRIKNLDESPVHYTMDPRQHIDALQDMDSNDWDLVAAYHSHTHTRAFPSATDVRLSQGMQLLYPESLHVIVSLADPDQPDIRAFAIQGENITEVQVTLQE